MKHSIEHEAAVPGNSIPNARHPDIVLRSGQSRPASSTASNHVGWKFPDRVVRGQYRLQGLKGLDLHFAGAARGVPPVQLVVELVAGDYHLCVTCITRIPLLPPVHHMHQVTNIYAASHSYHLYITCITCLVTATMPLASPNSSPSTKCSALMSQPCTMSVCRPASILFTYMYKALPSQFCHDLTKCRCQTAALITLGPIETC